MSVSSVKNLNGETFSAIQDASLTNVVQTNSGKWNEISAYELASANFITAHQDLSDYQTTAGMANYYTTAEADTLSSMLSGAIDYVSANAGGTTLTGDAQGALDEVYTNSGKWLTAHQSLSNYVSKSDTNVTIGFKNKATDSFAQGELCSAYNYSFAQGATNKANNDSFAQGENNKATGNYSFAQGYNNQATGSYSFAQGYTNSAANQSFAQGFKNSAYDTSFAQGAENKAYNESIAQGRDNYASNKSQAFGNNTKATNNGMAIGTYNNTESAAFVVGNGTYNARSDSFIIFHDGSVSAAGKISANGVELGAGGGGTTYTGDAQGALDKVYSNSGNWISTINNDASALFFAKKVVQGNSTLYGPVLSANANAWNDNSNYKFQIIANRLAFGFDDPYSHTSAYYTPTAISSRATSNGMDAGNWDWHLDYRGLGGKFSDNNENTATWSALRNIDIGLTTGGTISSISGHELTIGDVNNIVLTSTLPATPDANTLYLIPEA